MSNSFKRINQSSDRSFGLVFAAFFLAVALFPIFSQPHGDVLTWALIVAASFFFLALFLTRVLSPLNWIWTQLSNLLSKVTSPIAIGLLFYIGIVPISITFRALGKDPLKLKFDPHTSSYWITRNPVGPLNESMKNQF